MGQPADTLGVMSVRKRWRQAATGALGRHSPSVWVRRLQTLGRSGLLSLTDAQDPLQLARRALSMGLSVRSVHALHAATVPHRLALVDRHRAITYQEANDEINALAVSLRDQIGTCRRQPVAVMMETGWSTRWRGLPPCGWVSPALTSVATARPTRRRRCCSAAGPKW